MRREQYDEPDRQSSSDDSSTRRSGEPGGGQGLQAGAGAEPATGTKGGDRPTSPPNTRGTPADEWDGEPEQERLGRDLDAENG